MVNEWNFCAMALYFQDAASVDTEDSDSTNGLGKKNELTHIGLCWKFI